MKYAFETGCLIVAVFVQVAPLASAAPRADRPNVILMMADDMGWGDPAYMGNRHIRTPALDAMAGAGLRFNRFYAAGPVCSPTRGSCLTGRHPYRYGIYSANVGHLPDEEINLAELLRARGYRTGHFGKWHLGTLTRTVKDSNRGGPRGVAHYAPPWERGFDVCFSTEAKVPTFNPMTKPDADTPYGTAYWNTDGTRADNNLEGDDSRVIMDRVIPFVRDAVKRKRSFFAVVWFHAPHLPTVAGPDKLELYAEYAENTRHYYGCITALDEQVGRIRGELRALGVADNTMLWFCSDNGPEGRAGRAPGSAGALRGRKRSLYEGGIRVPALLEWPARMRMPRATDVPACTSDFLPTILDALGVKPPDDRPLDGVSLLPLIDGTMKQRPRPIAFESAGQYALIGNRYKLLHVPTNRRRTGGRRRTPPLAAPDARFQLFDLRADPAEQTDLADAHPDIVRQMTAVFRAWQISCRNSLNGHDYGKTGRSQ